MTLRASAAVAVAAADVKVKVGFSGAEKWQPAFELETSLGYCLRRKTKKTHSLVASDQSDIVN